MDLQSQKKLSPCVQYIEDNFFGAIGATYARLINQKLGFNRVLEVKAGRFGPQLKVVKRYFAVSTRNNTFFRYLNAEINILAQLRHPNIIRLHAAVACRSEDTLSIIMPMIHGGTLHALVQKQSLTTQLIWNYFIQVACALGFLHHHGIVHGDVKPSNILIDESNKPILIDFDRAHTHLKAGQSTVAAWHGTRGYMGPERSEGGGPVCAFKMEAYALGATLAFMVLRCTPQRCDPYERAKKLLATEDRSVRDLGKVIQLLCRAEPELRKSVEQLLGDLKISAAK